ncbi:MAG: DUF4230 domain-containing protein [Flavobacteriales bacterium]
MTRAARLLLSIGALLLVFSITREVYRPAPSSEQVSGTMLLERVRPVLKLVTVEGDFSELYDHTDSWTYNQLLAGLPGFRKRAIIRVKARVSVGYDLNGLKVSTDEATHTLRLDAPPKPQVLSVEHDLDYYDLDEGLFNHFSPQELTAMSAKAKQKVLDQLPASGLFAEAEKQRDDIVAVVRSLAESAGWKLELGWAPKDGRTLLQGRGQ